MPVQSFTALCDAQTHTLILGSMPGNTSIHAQEYYAHKRNGFWPIMLAIISSIEPSFELHQKLPYADKLNALQKAGFGLWDVLAECERKGSLDADIKPESVVMNDFVRLFTQCPNIKTIAFNGKTAERLFYRHIPNVLELANLSIAEKHQVCLPSSSPAMASLSLQAKHEQWKKLLKL